MNHRVGPCHGAKNLPQITQVNPHHGCSWLPGHLLIQTDNLYPLFKEE